MPAYSRVLPLVLIITFLSGMVFAEEAPPVPKTRTVEELAKLVNQSVVVVSYLNRNNERAGVGAGFIVSSDGLIATNMHVIGEAREISVQTADGNSYKATSIHATDRPMDLALIRIAAKNLKPLELGDSESLKQGQDVLAIGNPQGLKHSVVKGVVSGRRTIDGMPMIQLAIPIEPGNSGGPLLDMQGRVHGILTLKSLIKRNLGFAVGINALKPLLEKPNPIPIARWLTIGTLNPNEWQTLFGAHWRQRAGRILVAGHGDGFGGRSLCLSKNDIEKLPIEIGVSVKMKQKDGAAGLVFHSDGNQKHYGFYPSSGKIRLSRFEGPDVFNWKVLQEVSSPHYRPGEWNYIKVRLEKDHIQCFLNDELVIESTDTGLKQGRIGLAKFRHTEAEFKGFEIGEKIASRKPSPESIARISKLVSNIPTSRPPERKLIEDLLPEATNTDQILEARAKQLEQQAKRLRQLAKSVHEKKVRMELSELFQKKDKDVDLLRASLLIARLDNPEIEIESYLKEVDRLAAEISDTFPPKLSESDKIKSMDKFLFEELGFHGSRTDYYNSSNSYLNEVIDDREGLPITMSILYMELAKRLGLKVVGVGLPGHFITRFEPAEGERELIDAFDQGKRLTQDEAIKTIRITVGLEHAEEFLKAQTKQAIIQRMLQNLINVAQGNEDPESMLRYMETIVAINPEAGEQRMLRAVLRFQTDRHQEALEDIDWVLEHQPDGIDLERVHELRLYLKQKIQEQTN